MSHTTRTMLCLSLGLLMATASCAVVETGGGEDEEALGTVTQAAVSHAAAEVRAGGATTCVRRFTGGIACWGRALAGELGDGVYPFPAYQATPSSAVLAYAPALAAGTWIAAGADRACARTSTKNVVCWGDSWGGWPGGAEGSTPATLPGLTNVDQIVLPKRALNYGHRTTACARSAGGVRCWGGNNYGLLGTGTTDDLDHPTPVTIPGLGSNVAEIALGESHACARFTNGTVTCWGSNLRGKLGNGTTVEALSVGAPIAGLTGVVQLALGIDHTCALKSDGTIRCWGAGDMIGDGAGLQRTSPRAVSQFVLAAEIAAGSHHTCARMVDGTVQCWGLNTYGQLGTNDNTHASIPYANGLSGVAQLTAGLDHTCARTTTNKVLCWGDNTWGQLGDGTSTTRLSPTAVVGF